jgi:hypothetical protein
MVMLRDEDNAKYRLVVKNTLEFDPEILKRYVNFMNNPDERTAVDQFGSGDKYFGVCTLMATMPGLPMFGHGQVEGFTERYGMEYRRAYHDERPDPHLVARHEREIAPLLRRRALFAEARDFRLYDFFTADGWVNEDVFAYSNRGGGERALVVYHNRYARTQGWIRTSCAYAEKAGPGGPRLVQQTLGEALGFPRDDATCVAYRDARTALEYLHRSRSLAEGGLRLELEAYACHVFLDWRELAGDGRPPWGALADRLAGHGVPSLDEAMLALTLEPVHAALRAVLDPALVAALAASTSGGRGELRPTPGDGGRGELIAQARDHLRTLLVEAREFSLRRPDVLGGERTGDPESAIRAFGERLAAALRLGALEASFESPWPADARTLFADPTPAALGAVLAWCALEALGAAGPLPAAETFDALRLRAVVAEAAGRLGLEGEERWRAAARIRLALAHARPAPAAPPAVPPVALDWLRDPDGAWLSGVHDWEGVRYFVKERFEDLVWWMALPALLTLAAEVSPSPQAVRAVERDLAAQMRAAAASGYRVDEVTPAIGPGAS